MDELFQVAKVIRVNGSQVYYVNVDTNDGEIPRRVLGRLGLNIPIFFAAQSRSR